MPFVFVPVTIAAVAGVSYDQAGLASGLINTSQQIGGALGIAVLAAVANHVTTAAVADGTAGSAGGRGRVHDARSGSPPPPPRSASRRSPCSSAAASSLAAAEPAPAPV